MPLKLGLVTGEYPPMEGGVGAFTQQLARALSTAGHQVHIITDRRARPSSPDRQRWQSLSDPVDIEFARLHPNVRRWGWRALSVVADIVLRNGLDLVNIQYQAAAYDMRSAAVNFLPWRLKGLTRTVVTFHDLRVPYLFPKAGWLRRAAVNLMARQAHGRIVTNAIDYQMLKERVPQDAEIVQIPIGSNIAARQVDPTEAAAVRESLNLCASNCLLGYFGFLNESKGADVLLRAMAQLDDSVHLVHIGGYTGSSDVGSNRAFSDKLDALITDLGLSSRIHRSGFVSEAEVSAYLHAADVMVMPYRDGASLRRGTLMAVLAHGRPLITTTPVSPTPELRHGQNVYLVPSADATALADAIRTLMADADLRHNLGRSASETSRLFTWETIAAHAATYFSRLVAGPG